MAAGPGLQPGRLMSAYSAKAITLELATLSLSSGPPLFMVAGVRVELTHPAYETGVLPLNYPASMLNQAGYPTHAGPRLTIKTPMGRLRFPVESTA
jgi:hypothetical protein